MQAVDQNYVSPEHAERLRVLGTGRDVSPPVAGTRSVSADLVHRTSQPRGLVFEQCHVRDLRLVVGLGREHLSGRDDGPACIVDAGDDAVASVPTSDGLPWSPAASHVY